MRAHGGDALRDRGGFPANTYAPEIVLLIYTVFALAVGVYFRNWGAGVEIGLGLIAYSGSATLIAGGSLLLRRLLLQFRLRTQGGAKDGPAAA